ncbi:MAG TPA: YceI family protein [Chitinophagaceae bacterium]|nr:YceI family protein [Chitinophagaceae bacterium]
MKKTILALALVAVTGSLFAQKKTTTSATVAFDASTAIDNLPKAENKTVVAALDPKTGSVAFEATVKNFAFANPTIQQHFNGEKWMDSDKFPSFIFKGNIIDPAKVNFTKDGSYNTNVEGSLSIKGVEQKVKAPATIVVKGGAISATSNFSVKLTDFGISGAPIDAGKVSKEPKVTVSADFK